MNNNSLVSMYMMQAFLARGEEADAYRERHGEIETLMLLTELSELVVPHVQELIDRTGDPVDVFYSWVDDMACERLVNMMLTNVLWDAGIQRAIEQTKQQYLEQLRESRRT